MLAEATGTGGGAPKTCVDETEAGGVREPGGPVATVVVVVVMVLGVCSFFSGRIIAAAVTAAPVPALTAAIIAKVAFDILGGRSPGRRGVLLDLNVFYTAGRRGEGNDSVRRGWMSKTDKSRLVHAADRL